MRERWQRRPVAHGAGLTFLLSVSCIILTVLGNFGQNAELFELIKMKRSAYLGGEFWRFLTPMLSHGSIIHLVLNLMWLFQLGGLIEQKRGTLTLLLMTLVFAAFSNSLEFTMGMQRLLSQGAPPAMAEAAINFTASPESITACSASCGSRPSWTLGRIFLCIQHSPDPAGLVRRLP